MWEEMYNIIIMVFNMCCVSFMCILLARWMSRIENKVQNIKSYLKEVQRKSDVIYINQLYIAREELIKEERYEDADKINKIINEEIKRQKSE